MEVINAIHLFLFEFVQSGFILKFWQIHVHPDFGECWLKFEEWIFFLRSGLCKTAEHTRCGSRPCDVITTVRYRGICHQIHPQTVSCCKHWVWYCVSTQLIYDRGWGCRTITYLLNNNSRSQEHLTTSLQEQYLDFCGSNIYIVRSLHVLSIRTPYFH